VGGRQSMDTRQTKKASTAEFLLVVKMGRRPRQRHSCRAVQAAPGLLNGCHRCCCCIPCCCCCCCCAAAHLWPAGLKVVLVAGLPAGPLLPMNSGLAAASSSSPAPPASGLEKGCGSRGKKEAGSVFWQGLRSIDNSEIPAACLPVLRPTLSLAQGALPKESAHSPARCCRVALRCRLPPLARHTRHLPWSCGE